MILQSQSTVREGEKRGPKGSATTQKAPSRIQTAYTHTHRQEGKKKEKLPFLLLLLLLLLLPLFFLQDFLQVMPLLLGAFCSGRKEGRARKALGASSFSSFSVECLCPTDRRWLSEKRGGEMGVGELFSQTAPSGTKERERDPQALSSQRAEKEKGALLLPSFPPSPDSSFPQHNTF